MTNKTVYEYSAATQASKAIAYLAAFVGVMLSIYNMNKWGLFDYDTYTNSNAYMPIIGPIILGFSFVVYASAWPTIKVDDDGVYVEFLWKYLKVPWTGLS